MMVKRYDVGEYDEGGGNMISYEDESTSGGWVKYSDYEAEVERLETMVRWARADSEALNIENAKLKSALLEAMEWNWLDSDAPPRFEVDNLPEADGDN